MYIAHTSHSNPNLITLSSKYNVTVTVEWILKFQSKNGELSNVVVVN